MGRTSGSTCRRAWLLYDLEKPSIDPENTRTSRALAPIHTRTPSRAFALALQEKLNSRAFAAAAAAAAARGGGGGGVSTDDSGSDSDGDGSRAARQGPWRKPPQPVSSSGPTDSFDSAPPGLGPGLNSRV
eukprot:352128-Chlamydomonas_euryale.AAC.2